MSDGEMKTMQAAERAKRQRNHGFEGCANKACTHACYYLQHYSQEGLCSACELEAFPSRFVGCLFCRAPAKVSYVCGDCGSNFNKWIQNAITFSTCYEGNKRFWKSQAISTAVHKIKSQCVEMKVPFSLVHGRFGKWRGFYAGGDQWILPHVAITVDMDSVGYTQENPDREWYSMDCDSLACAILIALKQHGIDVVADIQIRSASSVVNSL
jgi:hypothetical protein